MATVLECVKFPTFRNLVNAAVNAKSTENKRDDHLSVSSISRRQSNVNDISSDPADSLSASASPGPRFVDLI